MLKVVKLNYVFLTAQKVAICLGKYAYLINNDTLFMFVEV